MKNDAKIKIKSIETRESSWIFKFFLNQLNNFLVFNELCILLNPCSILISHRVDLFNCKKLQKIFDQMNSFFVDCKMQRITLWTVIFLKQEAFIQFLLFDWQVFFNQPKIRMAVWIAIVFLLHHFQSSSALNCWRIDLFNRFLLIHDMIPSLNITLHFLFDIRSDFYSFGYVCLHYLWFRQSNITVPWVPFGLTDEIEHRGFRCITIAYCRLLVKTINDQFIFVRNVCWSLTNVLCSIFE